MHAMSSDLGQPTRPASPKLWRTHLYVPAHDERKVLRALDSAADCVVLDLEDAVPMQMKERARSIAKEICADGDSTRVTIRVNRSGSSEGLRDLESLADAPACAFRLPKVEDAAQVEAWSSALTSSGSQAGLILLLESARGIEEALNLARATGRVTRLAVGESDLAADLRTFADEGLTYSRSRVVSASRAAGLESPIASVYTNVKDLDGLRRSSELLRSLGFFGRSVIHPIQVDVVADVFRVSRSEYEWAREVVSSAQSLEETQEQIVLTSGGTFVDPAVLKRATWFLELASAFGVR